MLESAKKLKQNLLFVDKIMSKTDEMLNDKEDHKESCADMIFENKSMIEEMLNSSTNSSRKSFKKLNRSLNCSPDQLLELKFQMKMMQSTNKVFSKSLNTIQEKLKSKYFFGSVLELMKFLSDTLK